MDGAQIYLLFVSSLSHRCSQSLSGMVMGVFPPVSPPTVPTPQRVLDSAVSSRANAMFLVPSFLEVRSALYNK